MIACPSFLESKHKRSFFKIQNADKIILGVDLFSNIGHISSIGCISSVGCISNIDLRVITFWDELNL